MHSPMSKRWRLSQEGLELRILEFVADDSGDLGAYGIVEGEMRLPSMPKAATVIRRFALGPINRELFLDNSLREIRFTGCLRKVRLLQVSPETLRDRRLLPLNLDMVDAVRIRTPAKEFSFGAKETGGLSTMERANGPRAVLLSRRWRMLSLRQKFRLTRQSLMMRRRALVSGSLDARSPSCQFSPRTRPRHARVNRSSAVSPLANRRRVACLFKSAKLRK